MQSIDSASRVSPLPNQKSPHAQKQQSLPPQHSFFEYKEGKIRKMLNQRLNEL